MKNIREALEELVNKLEQIHADERYKGVWTHYMIHGMKYTGPNYASELEAAKTALSELRGMERGGEGYIKENFMIHDDLEAEKFANSFIDMVNADHDDVISFNRDIGCRIRDHIERLRREAKRLRKERNDWREKYFFMERAQSASIDQHGEDIKRIQRLERDKDELRDEMKRIPVATLSVTEGVDGREK